MIKATCLAFLACVASAARADLPSADSAYQNKEYERAFALYRELAELGHRNSQESLAVMYVNGEGVPRDNVLGYAWARIAAEQGDSEVVTGIVSQLEPHMTAGSRERAEALRAQFGQQALKARLLPEDPPTPQPAAGCSVKSVANPDAFYPRGSIPNEGSGSVLVDFTVQPDGRAHTTRAVSATLPILFDEPARGVVMHGGYKPKIENGVAVPCHLRLRVTFNRTNGGVDSTHLPIDKLPATKALAEAGDPRAQFAYAMVLLNFPNLNPADEAAFPWAVKAAQGGVRDAQYVVGVFSLAREPEKGVIWLEKSAAAGYPPAQLVLANYRVTTRADAASNADAARLLEAAVASNYPAAKASLAALLATAPQSSLRDPQRALQLIDSEIVRVKYDPVPPEVRAAALAWLGDFDGAVKHQKIAIVRARRLRWDVTPLEARLAGYEAKKTWTGNLIAW